MLRPMSVHPLESSPIEVPDSVPSDVLDPLLAEIDAAERELLRLAEAASTRIDAAHSNLRRAVLNLALNEGANPSLRVALAARLYWHHPNVAVGDIVTGFGFGNSNRLAATLPPCPSGYHCQSCGATLLADSRKRLRELRADPRAATLWQPASHLCSQCRSRAAARHDEEWPEDWFPDDDPWGRSCADVRR